MTVQVFHQIVNTVLRCENPESPAYKAAHFAATVGYEKFLSGEEEIPEELLKYVN